MSKSLSDRYCEGFCHDGGKKFSNICTGCEIAVLEQRIELLESAHQRIVTMSDNHEWVPYANISRYALRGEVFE